MKESASSIKTVQLNVAYPALIKKRIYQASLEECNLIAGQAKFGSTSQTNMEKAGMKIAYTKAIWVKK